MTAATRPGSMTVAERAAPYDDGATSVTEPVDPVKARRVIWSVLLTLAALQAWSARFVMTADGVSYVDLGDAIFGILSLMMTPLCLPTPDLIVSSAVFVAFGAMLRLRDEPTIVRHAVTLGLALAIGALAKSFLVPWSVVVFALLALAMRRSG